MTSAARSTLIAAIKKNKKQPSGTTGLFPRLEGVSALIGFGALVAVPALTLLFPRPSQRIAIALLAVSSAGVYATVPDTEHVKVVMVVVVLAAIVCLATSIVPPSFVTAAVALVIMAAALQDSAGHGAAIMRATGSFGVLLAAPVASWVDRLRSTERTSPIVVLLVVHCVVAGFSSRALIRQDSIALVSVAVGVALLAAVGVLLAAARPVAVEQ